MTQTMQSLGRRPAVSLEQPASSGMLPTSRESTRPRYTLPQLPPGMAHRFHAMIKPVGSACNLDCGYCFYLHKETLLGHKGSPRMADDLLEAHIRQYIEGQTGEQVVFSWQGGEPTLAGLAFFERVVLLEHKYKKPFQRIENDLQTNGTLLDEDWARFLKKHNFLVGLSCDGPADLHDHYRLTKGGKPTFDKVFAGARLLKKHKVPFNALCVVNRLNAKHGRRVYRFLTRELGAWFVQFIPCVEPKVFAHVAPQRWDPESLPVVGTPRAGPAVDDSVVTDWSVDPDDWGQFLCDVWDDWYRHDVGKVLVNLFESAVAQSVWFGNFYGRGVILMAGDDTKGHHAGTKAGSVIHQFQSSSIQMITEVAIDPAGNVWAANNWNDKDAVMAYDPARPTSTWGGGSGITVIYGVAAPVKTPLIGTVRKP